MPKNVELFGTFFMGGTKTGGTELKRNGTSYNSMPLERNLTSYIWNGTFDTTVGNQITTNVQVHTIWWLTCFSSSFSSWYTWRGALGSSRSRRWLMMSEAFQLSSHSNFTDRPGARPSTTRERPPFRPGRSSSFHSTFVLQTGCNFLINLEYDFWDGWKEVDDKSAWVDE